MPSLTPENIFTWLPPAILFLPLLAAVILLSTKKLLGRSSDFLAIAVMGLSFVLSVVLFGYSVSAGGAEFKGWADAQANPFVTSYPWMQIGSITLGMGFLVDNLSSFMSIIVTGLATLVLIYSIFYMGDDRKNDMPMYQRYYTYMCFFCFAMLGIVLSNNLLMTFVFWELVGLGSYFLIGFWYYKPPVARDHHYQELKASYATGIDERYLSPAYAQKKAFVMNRVGDFGFLSGIMIFLTVMLAAASTANGYDKAPLDFTNLYEASISGAFNRVEIWGLSGVTLLTLAGMLTFMGAIGKSAQFPLHTWLPDAMQGPTTGSSIIHAATMVAAGVYMTARIHPLLTDGSLFFVAMIGGITAFLAATMAMVQWDIKAVLAYSTISQLGYMMIGLGAGSYTAGVSHLFTHAIFKCMLFLCAGSVIHACHHLQDMNRMGGLKKKMPLTWLATFAGVLAISGVPLFSGFYSKDAILAASLARAMEMQALHWAPYVLGQITAVLTTYYMFRLFFWTFHGKPRDEHIYEHAHESPRVATVPLLILAVGCLGFWWSGTVVGKTGHIPGLYVQAEQVDLVSQGGGEKAVPKEMKTGWLNAMIVSPIAKRPSDVIKAHGEAHVIHHEHVHHTAHLWATGLSLAGLVLGLFAAWLLYYRRAIDPAGLVKNHPGSIGRLYELAAQLWFFDRLYQDGIVPLAKRVNALLFSFDFQVIDQTLVDGWAYFIRAVSRVSRGIDNWFVDRCVDLFGWTTWFAGTITRTIQAGKIQYYVCVTFGAVAVVLLVLLMRG